MFMLVMGNPKMANTNITRLVDTAHKRFSLDTSIFGSAPDKTLSNPFNCCPLHLRTRSYVWNEIMWKEDQYTWKSDGGLSRCFVATNLQEFSVLFYQFMENIGTVTYVVFCSQESVWSMLREVTSSVNALLCSGDRMLLENCNRKFEFLFETIWCGLPVQQPSCVTRIHFFYLFASQFSCIRSYPECKKQIRLKLLYYLTNNRNNCTTISVITCNHH